MGRAPDKDKKIYSPYGKKRIIDLSGQTFGRLKVFPTYKRVGRYYYWLCECSCGRLPFVRAAYLRNGSTKSCGCLSKDMFIKVITKHGMHGSRDYWSYRNKVRQGNETGDWCPHMSRFLRKLQPSCVLCGAETNLNIDHVYPLSKGGAAKPGNVVTLCFSCNREKSDKLPNELPEIDLYKIIRASYIFKEKWNGFNKDHNCGFLVASNG